MSGIFSFKNGDDAVMHSEFMAFVGDDESLLLLRGWAEKQGYPRATVQQGGPDMFAKMLESSSPPRMAIIDIDGQVDPISTLTRLISLSGGDCRFVIVGSANDVTLYRRMQSAGAVDYLVKPLSLEHLNQALAATLRGPASMKPEAKEARIVFFIGARGGVGTSTIALNTGWLMGHELNCAVALFDLDLQFGTSSLALDLEPGRGLRDIVSSPNRVDGLMIASSIVPESANFSVLGAEESVDEVVPIDGGAIAALLKEMKDNFDVIITELPRHMLAAHKRPLMAAHEIVLVSDMTLAGIRDTLRIKSALHNLGCNARITIVSARTNASGAGHVDRAVFEKGVQAKIDINIVEDTATFVATSNSGKAFGAAAPRAPVTKALRDLAMRLAEVEETDLEKPSFWDKLMSKANKDKAGRGKNAGNARGRG